MLRVTLPRLGRIRVSRPPPEEPVWPPVPENEPAAPFPVLPQAATRAATFSSSSPLAETVSPANERPAEGEEGGEDGPAGLPVKQASRWEVLAKRRAGSQFLDYMHLTIRGGRGGDGTVAFTNLPHRRDSRGPPSGGSGGEGGSIYIQASDDLLSLNTLVRNVKGKTGGNGQGDYQKGKKGDPVIIKVPPGTMIRQISRTVHRVLTPEEEALPQSERDPLVADRLLVVHPQARASRFNDIPPPPDTPAQRYGTTIHGTPRPPPPPIDLDLAVGMDAPVLLCRGGRGGEGNAVFGLHDEERRHLFARRGEVPDEIKLELELRLLADVGLLGAPNAGKSTLLQALTSSKPHIAAYQFTTLNPNIGLCRILGDGTVASAPSAPAALETPEHAVSFDQPVLAEAKIPLDEPLPVRPEGHRSAFGRRTRVPKHDEALRFKVCDNPGLIAGSHLNRGLGHQFLLSVARSPILVLVLDFSQPTAKLLAQAEMLLSEVRLFEPETRLDERIRLVVANKADLVRDPAQGRRRAAALRKWAWKNLGRKTHTDEETGETFPVGERAEVRVKLLSGKWGQGIRELAFEMGEMVVERREQDQLDAAERRRREREEEEEIIRELQVKILTLDDVPVRPPRIGYGLVDDGVPARDLPDDSISR